MNLPNNNDNYQKMHLANAAEDNGEDASRFSPLNIQSRLNEIRSYCSYIS